MTKCQRCKSERVMEFSAKCDDRCFIRLGEHEDDDYPPSIPGISGDDYLEPSICLDCGQTQGTFPIPKTDYERDIEDPEDA